ILLSTPDGPARLNKDGSPDTSFRPAITSPAGSDSAVLAAGIQQDQRIVLAGSFDLEGTNFNGIVRLNSDGSLDSTFLPVETLAERIVPQPDGRILLGGSFSQINGFFRPGLARLLSDGSLDSDFDPSDGFDRSLQPLVTD